MDKANIEGTVDWVFDDQGRVGKDANKWYEFIRASIAPQLRSKLANRPVFRHDKSVLPLKAADICSWQIRRYLDKEQPNRIELNTADNWEPEWRELESLRGTLYLSLNINTLFVSSLKKRA
jgi:hypothetical protein